MGSVSDDYCCPWCGRVGAGGYAIHGIDYPICMEDMGNSCLAQVVDHGLALPSFRVRQLTILRSGEFLAFDEVIVAPGWIFIISVPG